MGWWVDPGGVVGKKEEWVGIKVFSFTKIIFFGLNLQKYIFFWVVSMSVGRKGRLVTVNMFWA